MDNRKQMLPFETQYSDCTGCNACGQICPKNCITYQNGKMNFSPKECINCGLCAKVCTTINRSAEKFDYPQTAYASWSLDEIERNTSTSGGVAAVFYRQALEKGWYITGAAYGENFEVELVVTNNTEMVQAFKQSKYVFSATRNCYKQIKSLLNKENKVLFIGLPCQVAGLLQFLGKKDKNLVTVDIVCHGTPNSQILTDYIKAKDQKNKASKLCFRTDNEFTFKLMERSGRIVYQKKGRTDEYLAAFLEGLDYQEQCYCCKYARPERVSDLTIGDFWGLGSEKNFANPYTGAISLILVNSTVGANFLHYCESKLFLEEREVMEAINGNSQLKYPTPMHPKRDEFLRFLAEGKTFENAVKLTLHETMNHERRVLRKKKIRVYGSKLKRFILRSFFVQNK